MIGLLLALIPVSGYAFAYAFEFGAAWRLGIDPFLIQVTLTNGLIAAGLPAIVVTSFVMIVLALSQVVPVNWRIALIEILISAALVFIAVLQALIIDSWLGRILVLSIAGAFAFTALALPVFTQRDKAGYAEKLEASFRGERPGEPGTPNVTTFRSLPTLIRMVPMGGVILLILAFQIGQGLVRLDTQYLALNGSLESVVVRVYGDRAVVAPVTTEGCVQPSFTVLSLAELPGPLVRVQMPSLKASSNSECTTEAGSP